MRDRDWIHRALDGDPSTATEDGSGDLATYQRAISWLEEGGCTAPDKLAGQIMEALPDHPQGGALWSRWRARLGLYRSSWVPSLAGALAALLLTVGLTQLSAPPQRDTLAVQFELHAPGAAQVELVGTFNHWKPGDILLLGPDASGHWTATVEVPAGRHEYLFLVDGSEWLTDPNAPAHRPDGFGRLNALLEL